MRTADLKRKIEKDAQTNDLKGVIQICSVCHQIIDEKKALVQLKAYYLAFGTVVDDAGEDMHGAGAFRFDTKVKGGPLGEGDEQYYNYDRLVRDANLETAGVNIDNGKNQLPGDDAPPGIFTLDSQGGITEKCWKCFPGLLIR